MKESSRQLSKSADAKPKSCTLVLTSHRPERQKSIFDQAKLVIRSMVGHAAEVLGGLAVLLVHLNCPAVNELELPLFGA